MKRHIEEYPPNFGDGESVLTMLYECHNENSQIHIGTGGIGIVHIIQEVRGGEPHDLTAAIGIDGQGNREWTFDIAFLVFIGAQFKACQLAESLNIPNLLLYHTEESHLSERKKLYTEEGKQYFHGNLYVPDDLETFEI